MNANANSSNGADSVADLAAELRRLRLDAGSPTLAHLQHATGISRTVLSDALRGTTLPSGRTISALARACDTDPGPLLARRDALARPAREESDSPSTVPAPAASAPGISRRGAILLSAGTFAGGVIATLGILALIMHFTARPEGAPLIAVANGSNPLETACVDDAKVATGDTRADNSLLEIRWSDKCQAGWGRITRYDGKSMGNTVTIAIYPQTAPNGPLRQEVTEHDVQGAFTTLIVRPSPGTLLCAEGSYTVDGKRIDLGDPLCI